MIIIKNRRSIRKKSGVVIILVWQALVAVYSFVMFIDLMDVAILGGSEFGISNLSYLKLFYISVFIVNVVSFIGMFKMYNWARWLYLSSLTIVSLYRVTQSYLIHIPCNFFEYIILLINIAIIAYLVPVKGDRYINK